MIVCFYLSVAEHAIVENYVKSLSLLSYGVSQMCFVFFRCSSDLVFGCCLQAEQAKQGQNKRHIYIYYLLSVW